MVGALSVTHSTSDAQSPGKYARTLVPGCAAQCTQLSCSMQLSGVPRRNPGPSFTNHTPRAWEITAMNPSQFPTSSEMFGPTGMTVGSTSIMGQGSSKTERGHIRDDSSTIFRQNSIQQTEEGSQYTLPLFETEDSSSSHYHYTSQPHYNDSIDTRTIDGIANDNDKMMTQTSLSRLPRENASHDLAFFLRTTGPTAPHRKPSVIDNPRRTVNAPTKLRFFNLGGGPRKQVSPAQAAHERFVDESMESNPNCISANISLV